MSCSAMCVRVSTRQYNIPVPCLPRRGVNSFEKPLCHNIHAHCTPRNVIASSFCVHAEHGGVCVLKGRGGVDDRHCKTLYLLGYSRVCVYYNICVYNNIIIKSAINAREVHNIARLYTHTYTLFHLSPKFSGTHRRVSGCQLTPK